ncbi:MAG: DUF433 domain-containing protein [Chloroflexota bacterium]
MVLKPAKKIGSLLVARPGYREGRPCLRGTGITVHQVAAAHLQGFTAEEICQQNPDLDPSLFYAALAFYFANRNQIEVDLDNDCAAGEHLAARYPNGITSATFAPDSVPPLSR